MRRRLVQSLAVAVIVAAGAQPAPAGAQTIERVTFDDAVRRAVASHPTVQRAAADILRAEAVLQQTRSRSRPTVDFELATHVIDPVTRFSGSAIVPRTQTVTTPTIAVPIVSPVRWAERHQAGDQILVTQRTADDVRRQIAVATGQAYLTVVAQRRVVELNERPATTPGPTTSTRASGFRGAWAAG